MTHRTFAEIFTILESWDKQLSEIMRAQARILEVQPNGHNPELEEAAKYLREKLAQAKELTVKEKEFKIVWYF